MNSTREELLDSTTRLYIRAAQILDPLRLQVWEEKGITFPQLRILFRVRAQPGIDLQTLAAGLGMSASAASQQVDKLVNRGFLHRSEDPCDRRRVRLELAEPGHQVTGEFSRASRGHVESVLAALTDEELTELHRLLGRLVSEAFGSQAAPSPTAATSSSREAGS